MALNPVTNKILQYASNIVLEHHADWNIDQAQDFVLQTIREEEIKRQKFLVHFCKLTTEERKELWTNIFKQLVNKLPNKRAQKKLFKRCLQNIESCLDEIIKESYPIDAAGK